MFETLNLTINFRKFIKKREERRKEEYRVGEEKKRRDDKRKDRDVNIQALPTLSVS